VERRSLRSAAGISSFSGGSSKPRSKLFECCKELCFFEIELTKPRAKGKASDALRIPGFCLLELFLQARDLFPDL